MLISTWISTGRVSGAGLHRQPEDGGMSFDIRTDCGTVHPRQSVNLTDV
ncbi:MAG: hypothetical protein ACLFVE_13560 [Chitinispirillaceae bacterium]